jgi:hypothetical protein
MTREVRDLQWVRTLPERPDCIPKGRPRGAKAAGVRYEAAVAALPSFAAASHGLWLEFGDASGHGYAQADFVFTSGPVLVVAEAKLTWTPAAYAQLRRLYFPLLHRLSGLPVGGFVVCQNLTRETARSDVTSDLAEALRRVWRDPTRIPVLHLPFSLKEPRNAPTERVRVPSWWRKGQTSPRVGHPSGG